MTAPAIEIRVNGELRQTDHGQTLLGLLRELGLDPARVAIELNREIAKRPAWETTRLRQGDSLEIVEFVGGGAACQ